MNFDGAKYKRALARIGWVRMEPRLLFQCQREPGRSGLGRISVSVDID